MIKIRFLKYTGVKIVARIGHFVIADVHLLGRNQFDAILNAAGL